jgi:hypothetical protein
MSTPANGVIDATFGNDANSEIQGAPDFLRRAQSRAAWNGSCNPSNTIQDRLGTYGLPQ